MKLIAEKLALREKHDRLHFVRADGTKTQCMMPRQGTLPHDLIHFVVESVLPLKHGFLSLVAAGADAVFVMKAVHDVANDEIETGAVQAEALVEALQTQLWAGAFDSASFLHAASLAANSRGKSPFVFDRTDPVVLYEDALQLLGRWNEVSPYQCLELKFMAGQA